MKLKTIFQQNPKQPQMILISGKSGSGKTTFCKQQIEIARKEGLRVAGLLSPAIFKEEEKVGIELINLDSGEKRQLAKLRPQLESDQIIKRWLMNEDVIEWANESLKKIAACDLLVIDELGPLEFISSQGFQEAFSIINAKKYHVALVVIRPDLIHTALERFQDIPHSVHQINR
jgi:nucleoside-triphosphatase